MTLPITVVTLFPDMFPGPLGVSIMKRAEEKGLFALSTVQIRDFAFGKHKTVDDTPYGGGAGMVMRPDVVAAAIRHAKKGSPNAKVVYMSPSGTSFNQEKARQLASHEGGLILLCGHYEGIDDRVLQAEVDEEISIGDYVLSGGELAAAIVCDAVIRLIPGVLNDETSALTDTFQDNLLAPPVYTRPAEYKGQEVPKILLSGNTPEIEKWREQQALERTQQRRPDLLE